MSVAGSLLPFQEYPHSLKPFLSQEELITVVHAFITSCIDYFNSLLYRISKYSLNLLQPIQNSAAHIIVIASKYDQKLHWLIVDQCIQFKVLLTTYKAVSGEAPEYLCDLVSPRALRSSSHLLLHVHVSCLESNGDCAFCVAHPRF